jgi:serine/threonine protein kinase
MGELWEARRRNTAKVAVKFLRADHVRGAEDRAALVRLFTEEVAHLIALQGSGEPTGIVTLLDHGEWRRPAGGPGLPYFVMPLLQGRPLDEALALRDLPVKLECFARVCDAVARVHARRRLHLDLKPDNLFVTEKDGQLYPTVVDFGLAAPFRPGVPLPGVCIGRGTPRYMAPEQFSPKHGEMGPATDLYALGVILFTLLTLRHPCGLETKRTDAAVRRAVLAGPKHSLLDLRPDLPQSRELSAILDRALRVGSKPPFREPGQMAEALRKLLAKEKATPAASPQAGTNRSTHIRARTVKYVRRIKAKTVYL